MSRFSKLKKAESIEMNLAMGSFFKDKTIHLEYLLRYTYNIIPCSLYSSSRALRRLNNTLSNICRINYKLRFII